ncbi:MAG: (deoxy)nucleoside triphosphate pyrophosphohydrolase [Casimicrobiaceae bacterium]|nr:(deoxy)nucleoside triphosphate pyrophosphohydrolase [Casimicrobiaceae bacterium]MCX8098487.1 (deoxy)nucleoside triphosphate pyrophosphohydrolase [Casimicrobiaceae bacterium]
MAVGILFREGRFGRQVLLAERPPGKVYAHYWEFPGGKVEAGETPEQALIRELEEELAVRVCAPQELVCERFSYPHAHVELTFFVCPNFTGEPRARESQRLAWEPIDAIRVSPLLPALLHPRSQVLARLAAWQPARGR